MSIKITIGGDLSPIRLNEKLFIKGHPENIWNYLTPYFLESDFNIVNLECVLTKKKHDKIKKIGMHIRSAPEVINGIKNSNIHLCNLANNHIMDFGEKGLNDTIETMNYMKINHVGAGFDLSTARKPFKKKIDKLNLSVLSVTDREFSFAHNSYPGANPLELAYLLPDIYKIRKESDFLIVLIHKGPEYYPYPSPKSRLICKASIDLGADLVVCQHSHVIGSYELYKDKLIVYGQGNLIFRKRFNSVLENWHKGILIALNVNDTGEKYSFEFIPFIQSFKTSGINQISKDETEKILKELQKRTVLINDETFLKTKWKNFCEKYNSTFYYYNILPSDIIRNRVSAHILKLLVKYIPKKCNTKKFYWLLNCLRSEDHREVFEEFFI